jgi:hypothetical protein
MCKCLDFVGIEILKKVKIFLHVFQLNLKFPAAPRPVSCCPTASFLPPHGQLPAAPWPVSTGLCCKSSRNVQNVLAHKQGLHEPFLYFVFSPLKLLLSAVNKLSSTEENSFDLDAVGMVRNFRTKHAQKTHTSSHTRVYHFTCHFPLIALLRCSLDNKPKYNEMNIIDSNTQDTTALELNNLTGGHWLLVTIRRQSDFLLRSITYLLTPCSRVLLEKLTSKLCS